MKVDRRISPEDQRDGVAYLVGQDGEGHWLAVEIHGLGGGIFSSRDKAVQYAQHESHRLPGAVRFADGPVQLFAA